MMYNKGVRDKFGGWRTGIKAGLFFFVCLFFFASQGYSQETASPEQPAQAKNTQGSSDEDLLKAVQNPVSDLISLPIQNTTNFNIGPHNRNDNVLSLQPVIPVTLSENWLLATRIVQPIAWKPYLDQDSGGQFGLGDMNPSFFLAPRKPGSIIWGVGPAMVIPTATDDILGEGMFSLGPSAVVLAQPGNWSLGVLASNIWSVAGPNSRPSVNRMSVQYFITYNLKDDWSVSMAPTIVADWNASSSDRWLVPVGGGIGKLVFWGKSPIDLSASFYVNVAKPDGGPNWQLNLQVAFLFPK